MQANVAPYSQAQNRRGRAGGEREYGTSTDWQDVVKVLRVMSSCIKCAMVMVACRRRREGSRDVAGTLARHWQMM